MGCDRNSAYVCSKKAILLYKRYGKRKALKMDFSCSTFLRLVVNSSNFRLICTIGVQLFPFIVWVDQRKPILLTPKNTNFIHHVCNYDNLIKISFLSEWIFLHFVSRHGGNTRNSNKMTNAPVFRISCKCSTNIGVY